MPKLRIDEYTVPSCFPSEVVDEVIVKHRVHITNSVNRSNTFHKHTVFVEVAADAACEVEVVSSEGAVVDSHSLVAEESKYIDVPQSSHITVTESE